MIEAETRARGEKEERGAEGGWSRRARASRAEAPGGGSERAAERSERLARERERAASYLDLWERHVSGTATRGRGIAAPWFSR